MQPSERGGIGRWIAYSGTSESLENLKRGLERVPELHEEIYDGMAGRVAISLDEA